ncbi:MAG: FecR family protein [Leadbetterella sp.]|nr:FecR family protein [Leadbetterella sp.]
MEHFDKNWKKVAEERQILDRETDRRVWAAIQVKAAERRRARSTYGRVAAAILLIPLMGLMFYLYTSKDVLPQTGTVHFTASKAPETYRLPDGSEVKLEAGSVLTLAEGFGGSHRQVTFEGRAYFDIAKDPNKPFVVNAKSFEVQVLGTRFFLDQMSGEKKVELFEGKVEIAHAGERVTLAPQEIWVKDENERSYLFDAPEAINNFTFDNENYDYAIQKLEETYRVKIDYPSAYKTRKISGSFHGSLNDVLTIISYPFNLKPVKINEREIELK